MFSMGKLEYLCSKSWILDTPEVFSYPDLPRPNGCEVPSVTRLTLQRKYWFNFPFDSSSFFKIFETRLINYLGSFAAMIKWRKSRQDTEYKPGLNSRREHNAQRSYIGHAQRINFGRPRPKFPAQNFKRRPPKETTAFTQNMVRENSRLFAHIPLLITGFLLIYYCVLSFHYRKHCRVFKHHDLLAWVVIYMATEDNLVLRAWMRHSSR